MLTRLAPLLAAAGLTLNAAYTPEQIAAESAKANAFFERTFEATVQRSPIFLTQLGQKDQHDRWDDFSEHKQAEDLALAMAWQHELKRDINYDALDEQTKISYRMWLENAEQSAEAWRWRYHGYVFSQMGGMHSNAPALLINFHAVDNVADARAYIGRLNGLARVFDQLMGNAREAQARGVLPPKFVFPLLIEASREVITGAPFDKSEKKSALFEDVEGKIAALKDADAATKQQGRLARRRHDRSHRRRPAGLRETHRDVRGAAGRGHGRRRRLEAARRARLLQLHAAPAHNHPPHGRRGPRAGPARGGADPS
jgi:uncharacterized protein (DUF885 family)